MASTALATVDELSDRYPLLSQDDDIREAMEDNMDGDSVGLFDLVRVTIPAGGLTFWSVDGKPVEKLKGVIIAKLKHRSYWESKRGEGGGDGPPDCASEDAEYGRGVYGVGSEKHPDGACATCPMNQWTPDADGKRRKGCKEQARLIMMLHNQALPIQIQLPPTSLGPLRKQLLIPLTSIGKSFWQVEVAIGLESKGSGGNPYSVVDFEIGAELPVEQARVLKAVGDNVKDNYLAQNTDD